MVGSVHWRLGPERAELLERAIEELGEELARGDELAAEGILWPGDENELEAQRDALGSWRSALAELRGAIE